MNKTKTIYEAPAMLVVELKMEGVICGSNKGVNMAWFLDGTSFGSADFEWSRDSYGSAVDL